MTSVCVTLREKSADAALSLSGKCRSLGADLVEIRLDHMGKIDWAPSHQTALATLGLGSVLTLRPEWEGGHFCGSEEERASLILEALRTCPDHVDIELDMDERLRDPLVIRAKELGVRTIISHHDLTMTPSYGKMMDIIERCVGAGGDIAKLAVKCSSVEDAVSLMHLARDASKKGFKYSIMGMGLCGHITRVLAPRMGCEMVYASMDDPASSDQIDIRTLKRIWELTGTGQWR